MLVSLGLARLRTWRIQGLGLNRRRKPQNIRTFTRSLSCNLLAQFTDLFLWNSTASSPAGDCLPCSHEKWGGREIPIMTLNGFLMEFNYKMFRTYLLGLLAEFREGMGRVELGRYSEFLACMKFWV